MDIHPRVKDLESIPGWSGLLLCSHLYRAARDAAAEGQNVEIGAYFGRTSVAIARGLEDRGRNDELVCIDPFDDAEEEALAAHRAQWPPPYDEQWVRFVRGAGVTNAELLAVPSRSEVARVRVGGPIRFAFVDGDHRPDAVMADAEWLVPLMAPGGVMALDDCGANTHRWGVHEAVDRLVRPNARRELYPESRAQNCIFFEMKGGAR